MSQRHIHIIGAQSGLGAQDHGCADGPVIASQSEVIKNSPNFCVEAMIEISTQAEISLYQKISEWCQKIAEQTYNQVVAGKFFNVIGGDHSSAIGTWSGVSRAIASKGALGLLWIDAHLDSHTPETTESGAIHGMPVAALLGHGDPRLAGLNQPPLLPQNLCLIGIRSYEKGEYRLLEQLGVKVFYMQDIIQLGLAEVLTQALKIVTENTTAFGISIDIDAFDPADAPGTGTPEPEGIRVQDFIRTMSLWKNHPKLIGSEIAEFNPHKDINGKTEQLITTILTKLSSQP